jgi:type II secretory pathway pseudopilin PulG
MRRRGLRSAKLQVAHHKLQTSERGYILITLMLFVALLTIAALAVLPEIKQQIQRDREEELRHRGSAYMRAVQRYFKKTGRYPARLEELENTNNIRFLRKRYKDPITGKDFKLLRMGDKELSTLGVQSPGLFPGGTPPGLHPGQAQNTTPPPFAGGTAGNIITRQTGGFPQTGGISQTNSGNVPNPTSDDSEAGDTGAGAANAGPTQANSGAAGSGPLQSNSASGNNPLTLGGGPILGVMSPSKGKSVREFGDKIKHYNEWLFVYDPTADRGGLIYGPVVPNSLGGGGMGTPAGTMANQSQGGASGNQPKTPSPPQPQSPPNPQAEPPEE